jgi:hypothetical protein
VFAKWADDGSLDQALEVVGQIRTAR